MSMQTRRQTSPPVLLLVTMTESPRRLLRESLFTYCYIAWQFHTTEYRVCKRLCVKCPTVSPPHSVGKNKCKLDMITVPDLTSSKNVANASVLSPTSEISLLLSSHSFWSLVLLNVRALSASGTSNRHSQMETY